MSAIDRIVEWWDPVVALRRRSARDALASYESAEPSRYRKSRRSDRSINDLVQSSAVATRAQIRYLERNHDLARGILRTLVNNTIGPAGIGIEPQPRLADGSIATDYASALREAWQDWQRHPEVTARLRWPQVQRLVARTWMRDGEAFAQDVIGKLPSLEHGTRVPYSIELLEPDMVPLDYDDDARGVRQGIERDTWGRARAYWVHKTHPSERLALINARDLKRVPAERMMQVATIDRIGQLRGMSEFASILARLDDLKDYEESERIAAKIAARLTAFVRKGTPDMFDPNRDAAARDADGNLLPRDLRLEAGTIVDGLSVGEEIGLIDSKRPNPNLVTWRQGQLRAIAAGVGVSYSSSAKDYNGTYSAQRQELVEQWVNYATLADEFAGMFVRPVWETFVRVADLSGVVRMPAGMRPDMADDALCIGQSMPWIDPLKEAKAWQELTRAGFATEVEVMRKRGANPRDVLDQLAEFRRDARALDLVLSSDAATDLAPAASAQPPEDDLADTIARVTRAE